MQIERNDEGRGNNAKAREPTRATFGQVSVRICTLCSRFCSLVVRSLVLGLGSTFDQNE